MDREEVKNLFVSIKDKSSLPTPVSYILISAAILRIIFWIMLPPAWKIHPAVYSIDKMFLEYCGDFIGYMPTRPPFIDWVQGRIYLLTGWLLGTKGFTLLSTILSIISLPFCYKLVKRLFDEKVAFYALLLLAFYPKLIYMAARGLPEVTSLSLVIFSLYFLEKGVRGKNWSILISGVLATFAYLVYLPAILLVGLTVTFILFKNRKVLITGIKQSCLYFVPASIAFYLHYTRGPLKKILIGTPVSIHHESIFVNPGAYPILEKIGRYLFYSFFDFWWHYRGFDWERPILHYLNVVGKTLPFSNMLMLIWFFSAVLITIPVFFSLKRLIAIKNKKESSKSEVEWLIFIFITFGLYWVWWWHKAIFKHGLQTRHIFPQLVFFSIIFGLGVKEVESISRRVKKIIPKLFYAAFIVLIITAFGNAALYACNLESKYVKSIKFLEEEQAINKKKIGVLKHGNYRYFHIQHPYKNFRLIQGPQFNETTVYGRVFQNINYIKFDKPKVGYIKEVGIDYVVYVETSLELNEFDSKMLNSLETNSDSELIYDKTIQGKSLKIFKIIYT